VGGSISNGWVFERWGLFDPIRGLRPSGPPERTDMRTRSAGPSFRVACRAACSPEHEAASERATSESYADSSVRSRWYQDPSLPPIAAVSLQDPPHVGTTVIVSLESVRRCPGSLASVDWRRRPNFCRFCRPETLIVVSTSIEERSGSTVMVGKARSYASGCACQGSGWRAKKPLNGAILGSEAERDTQAKNALNTEADARIRTADPFITNWARLGTLGHRRAWKG
jgi:hypothetical protein